MLRELNEKEQQILNELSNKYLSTSNVKKTSLEVELVTPKYVTFWVYKPFEEEGTMYTMPWFEFAIAELAPVLFKSKPFNFNGIMAKCILRPTETQENLIESFLEFDKKESKAKIRKENDAKARKKDTLNKITDIPTS